MSIPGLLQVVLYVVLIFAITKPLGLHLWRVFSGERTLLDRAARPAGAADLSPDRREPGRGAGLGRLRVRVADLQRGRRAG